MSKVTVNKKPMSVNGPPAHLIELAISNGGIDLERLEKLLAMQFEWEKNEARKAYNDAMARVHQQIPSVVKTKRNPQTNSKYADLNEIITQTRDIYSKEGFSVSFYEGEGAVDGTVRVCADIVHRLGHIETRHYDVPLDGIGIKGNPNMTKIHAKASSVSYGRRYLMCMIFNIPTGDDTDGNMPSEKIDENKLKILRDDLELLKADEKKFCEYMGVEKMEDIPSSGYAKAKAALEARKREKAVKK